MPALLTIWSNRALPPDAAADFERRLSPHRLVWAADLAASNLSSAPSDTTLVNDCDVAFGQPSVDDLLTAKQLKLVCLSSAGYTRYDRADLREHCKMRGIALCNASDVYAEPCAQHLLAFMLSAARRLPEAAKSQLIVRDRVLATSFRRAGRDKPPILESTDRDWASLPIRANSVLLAPGVTLLIVGYGAIARRLVELLAPFGMTVRAFRRAPSGNENCPTSPIAELDRHLPDADHVVNILPLNEDTKRFFDANRIAQMKHGVRFYNIGRGDTIDQPALVKALISGQVGQAYLDVTSPEPLPLTDTLWITPNCHITPHTAGGSADETERQTAHFLDNLDRFAKNQPLRDRVF